MDLVLTDLEDLIKVTVLPSVADHRSVLCELRVCTSTSQAITRTIWRYDKADWEGLIDTFRVKDWSFLMDGTVDQAAESFTQFVLARAREFIPQKTVQEEKGSHRWINEHCRKAAQAKDDAEKLLMTQPSDEHERTYHETCQTSSAVLGSAYEEYVSKTRSEIDELPDGSKKWWRLHREVMQRSAKASSIPPLKNGDGAWILGARDKANLLATTLSTKCTLPPEVTTPHVQPGTSKQPEFTLIRRCWSRRCLRAINADKTTGPDTLPGLILKHCSEVLDLPVTMLTRRMVNEGIWPECWREHWIHALFKKGFVYDPEKYRGLHLTSIMSKTIERIVSINLTTYLNSTDAYGTSQWAFRPGHSCRDLVALVIAIWLLEFHQGKRVAVYLGDVSGAFDRVDTTLLLKK